MAHNSKMLPKLGRTRWRASLDFTFHNRQSSPCTRRSFGTRGAVWACANELSSSKGGGSCAIDEANCPSSESEAEPPTELECMEAHCIGGGASAHRGSRHPDAACTQLGAWQRNHRLLALQLVSVRTARASGWRFGAPGASWGARGRRVAPLLQHLVLLPCELARALLCHRHRAVVPREQLVQSVVQERIHFRSTYRSSSSRAAGPTSKPSRRSPRSPAGSSRCRGAQGAARVRQTA